MEDSEHIPVDSLSAKPSSFDAVHLVSLFGFSCFLIWEFFTIFEMNPLLASFFTAIELNILRPIAFFFLAFGFLFVYLLSSRLTRLPIKTFFILGLVTSFGPVLIALLGYFLGSVPFWIGVVAWIMFGLSLTFLMSLWASYFADASLAQEPLVVIFGYVIGFFVFLLLSLVQASLLVYIFVGFLLIASTFATLAFLWKGSMQFEGAREYRNVSRTLSPQGMLHSGAYGVIYGFVLIFLLSLGSVSAFAGVVGGTLGCIMTWVFLWKKKIFYSSTHFRRATFAPVIIAVLFLPIGGSVSYIACSILVISATVSTAIVSWIVPPREMAQRKLNPAVFFSLTKLPGWAGFFLGSLVGSLMLVFAPDMFSVVTILLAALISLSFFAFEMQLHDSDGQEQETPIEMTHRFYSRCSHIIETNSLSPREAEVFHLLAKGRNAEYISQTLCIAKPTTKTHIQHIYQKLGINSHQELIDIIDSRAY